MPDTPPLFMASVFKSGTWLVRQIIGELTRLPWHEPAIVPGEMNYDDAGLIDLRPDSFFSWHSIPTPAVCQLLAGRQAKVVFLMRNIFDLAVSMYQHFARDVDSEIGRGTGTAGFFAGMSVEQGLSLTICGCDAAEFRWVGMGPHLAQIEGMLAFASAYHCHLMSYEGLLADRPGEIERLAEYLGVRLDAARLADIVAGSDFQRMKAQAEQAGGGSHFQHGSAGRHATVLGRGHVYMIRHLLRVHAPNLVKLAARRQMGGIVSCALDHVKPVATVGGY